MYKKENSLIKKFLSNQSILTILGLIIVVLISFPLAKNVSKQYKINKEIDLLKGEINNLSNKNSQLKTWINFIESDQFIDEKARLDLNYKKQGENVVVINEKEETADTAANASASEPNAKTNINNFEKWCIYFFKKI